MGAIQIVENMDRTTLTISDEEFEANVEAAVSAIAEKQGPSLPSSPLQSEKPSGLLQVPNGESSAAASPTLKATDAGDVLRPATPRDSTSSNEGAEDDVDEKAAISGLFRSIQRPLTTIGRMFTEDPSASAAGPSAASPARTPQPERAENLSQARQALSAEEAAARQASAEAAEAQRLHRAEHANVVETLAGMFPDLDRDIISDVVYQKEGR